MTRPQRLLLFVPSLAGLAAVLGWGLAGLPAFGDYRGPYGLLVIARAAGQRHIANSVGAVTFDYRGIDTFGEETILLAAASATAMLLRETREARVRHLVDRVRSDACAAVSAVAAVATFVLGLQVIAHGLLTPGGGFQGGTVVAVSLVWVFLGVEYWSFHRLARSEIWDPVEALGGAGYAAVGLSGLVLGRAFLQNVLPLGTFGRLTGGGSDILLSWASGLAVAGGVAVIAAEYLQEAEAARWAVGNRRLP